MTFRQRKRYVMHKLNCRIKLAVMLMLAPSIDHLWAQPIRWNVLFFISDEHNPHYTSIDSQLPQNISTPNLDRLAKEGMIFDKTYVAFPVCAPTRASIITGEYPQVHRQLGNSDYLIEAGPTGKTPSLGLLFRAEVREKAAPTCEREIMTERRPAAVVGQGRSLK